MPPKKKAVKKAPKTAGKRPTSRAAWACCAGPAPVSVDARVRLGATEPGCQGRTCADGSCKTCRAVPSIRWDAWKRAEAARRFDTLKARALRVGDPVHETDKANPPQLLTHDLGIEPVMTSAMLHTALDELTAAFLIANPHAQPSKTTILQLLVWSHERTKS